MHITLLALGSRGDIWLFPRMAMIIHHGGSGMTAFGLRSGVPSCVVPFVFEQFYWGERIAALGVGPPPIRQRQFTVARLSKIIQQGVSDTTMRQKARDLGQKLQAENEITQAIRLVASHS